MAVQPDKIHLVPNDENIAFLFPKENLKAELGYELFKKTASLVMPLIKLRKHGSRIKLPKECNRILEQKQLKAFILNPSSLGTE
jgi:hypothetical protein